MSHKLLDLPHMVMIGSFGRNSGKTTLACRLIEEWHTKWPVYGIKVVSIDKADGKCHRGGQGCGICTSLTGEYELLEETGGGEKDTALLLRAGAEKVFLLKSLRTALPKAMEEFAQSVPQNALIVCESNTARKVVTPGVFLFAGQPKGADSQAGKPSAKEVFALADRVVPFGEDVSRLLCVSTEADGRLRVALRGEKGGQGLPMGEEKRC